MWFDDPSGPMWLYSIRSTARATCSRYRVLGNERERTSGTSENALFRTFARSRTRTASRSVLSRAGEVAELAQVKWQGSKPLDAAP
jgi:hypothetical protein